MIIGDASKARVIAAFMDHLIAFALMMLVLMFVPESLSVVKAVLFFLVYLGYYLVTEALWSRTLGKLFQGLVVRKLDGSRCDWKAALIRSALRIVEVNPLLLGGVPAGLVVMATKRKQRIGDLLAGTLVVSNETRWNDDSIQSTTEQSFEANAPR